MQQGSCVTCNGIVRTGVVAGRSGLSCRRLDQSPRLHRSHHYSIGSNRKI